MTTERRRRLIRLARERGDLLALAVLMADRRWRPEPDWPVVVGYRTERAA